jgi:hypothetical protein
LKSGWCPLESCVGTDFSWGCPAGNGEGRPPGPAARGWGQGSERRTHSWFRPPPEALRIRSRPGLGREILVAGPRGWGVDLHDQNPVRSSVCFGLPHHHPASPQATFGRVDFSPPLLVSGKSGRDGTPGRRSGINKQATLRCSPEISNIGPLKIPECPHLSRAPTELQRKFNERTDT